MDNTDTQADHVALVVTPNTDLIGSIIEHIRSPEFPEVDNRIAFAIAEARLTLSPFDIIAFCVNTLTSRLRANLPHTLAKDLLSATAAVLAIALETPIQDGSDDPETLNRLLNQRKADSVLAMAQMTGQKYDA